jgi:hypothetical protein
MRGEHPVQIDQSLGQSLMLTGQSARSSGSALLKQVEDSKEAVADAVPHPILRQRLAQDRAAGGIERLVQCGPVFHSGA